MGSFSYARMLDFLSLRQSLEPLPNVSNPFDTFSVSLNAPNSNILMGQVLQTAVDRHLSTILANAFHAGMQLNLKMRLELSMTTDASG